MYKQVVGNLITKKQITAKTRIFVVLSEGLLLLDEDVEALV